ncbi:hypothetical protein G7046_g3478 [Stylonectria norvegica]|nr:hypothetical protein G7046_g3478 [Stylonectria norvegica]
MTAARCGLLRPFGPGRRSGGRPWRRAWAIGVLLTGEAYVAWPTIDALQSSSSTTDIISQPSYGTRRLVEVELRQRGPSAIANTYERRQSKWGHNFRM